MTHLRIAQFATLFLCILGLYSCDPVRTILVTNNSKKDISLRIVQDTSYYYNLGQEQVYQGQLSRSGDGSEEFFSYGMGTFLEKDVADIESMIKEIGIQHSEGSCTISGDVLSDYLSIKRKGLLKSTIVLKISKCPK